ncbi:MAG: protein-export chaperone SecB [Azoarcus sp.]|jgi:preprotein translocase subunit SecB|nr:protein-export chaperone SecB [Azoarcus sp.]
MADNNQAAENNQPIFSIEKIYAKDLSLEVPNAPQSFLIRETPHINVKLNTESGLVDANIYEVKLTITVEATLSDKRVLFLVEVVQAGIFRIQNIVQNDLELVLGIGCPNILFPYAREVVSDAVTRAGFQPVLLAPVNFEALFNQARQQAQAAGQQTPLQ